MEKISKTICKLQNSKTKQIKVLMNHLFLDKICGRKSQNLSAHYKIPKHMAIKALIKQLLSTLRDIKQISRENNHSLIHEAFIQTYFPWDFLDCAGQGSSRVRGVSGILDMNFNIFLSICVLILVEL